MFVHLPIDERAISISDSLKFVQAGPKWKRSWVASLFADDNYLIHWAPNDEPGNSESADMAVVNVSWFSTRVYCRWQGISLPTVIQWEPAAAASETKPYAYDDEVFTRRTMDWYAPPVDELRIRCASYLNLFEVCDIHGLMWEWTRDFNTALVSGESRRDSKSQRQLVLRTGSVDAADIFV